MPTDICWQITTSRQPSDSINATLADKIISRVDLHPMNPVLIETANNKTADDKALIERLLARDEQAFCELIKNYQRVMLTVARAIIGDAFAEDVVQEAWASVYSALPRFEGRSSLKTWILTIVSNEAKARLRRESRMVSLDALDGETPGSYLDAANFQADGHWQHPPAQWNNESPDALLEERQLQLCIANTLNLLPPLQKAAFLLRDVEQQSFDEICTILQVSAANARVLVHRARLHLMQVIDRYQETGEC